MAKKQQVKNDAAKAPVSVTGASVGSSAKWYVYIPLALALIVFITGLNNAMTGLDDHTATSDNPAVNDFSLTTLFSQFNLGMYAPVTWLFYAVAYALGGKNPFVYHLFSLLVHLANVYLAFQLARRLLKDDWQAMLAAAIFAIHPLQVESVSWIAGFSTPLFSLFSLLSIQQYLNYTESPAQSVKNYWFAVLLFIVACLAKTNAVTLPLVLVVIDWWKRPAIETRKLLIGYAPFFLIALGFGLLTIYSREVSQSKDIIPVAYSLSDRFWMVNYALVSYLGKMLFPVGLSVFNSFDKVDGAFPAGYFVAPVVVAAAAFAVWKWGAERPWLRYGALFYLANMIFSLPYRTVGTFELFSDHYNYLGVLGLAIVLIGLGGELRARFPRLSSALGALAAIWMLAITVLSIRQVKIWKDTLSVVTNAIDRGYNYNGRAHLWRGVAYGDAQQFELSVQELSKAIAINPSIMEAYQFRGSLYAQLKQYDKALDDLRKYVDKDPSDGISWFNIGMIYLQKREPTAASIAFTKSIELKPKAWKTYENRAKAYQMMGDTARANADRRTMEIRRAAQGQMNQDELEREKRK